MSEVMQVARVHCQAFDCMHNTINRSGGKSIGFCDYKDVHIDDAGQCKAFEK